MMTRAEALRLASRATVVVAICVVGVAAIFVRALVFTPIERAQGPAQKIFYVHVPSAWVALMAFSITGLLSIGYLWLKDRRLDTAAAASAEVGVVFSVILLITGPIWGKAVWGTWWQWEARLTSTLFLFLLFVGYLLLRGTIIDHDMRARFSAVIGILGMVLVPFIHMTVYLFRTIHPQPVVLKPSGPTLPGSMLITLLSSFGVFTVLYLAMVTARYALATLEDLKERELHHVA